MGVSVETSGIKVETGKYYLVNLNADPSLNELLVYYLKVRSALMYVVSYDVIFITGLFAVQNGANN